MNDSTNMRSTTVASHFAQTIEMAERPAGAIAAGRGVVAAQGLWDLEPRGVQEKALRADFARISKCPNVAGIGKPC